MWRKSRSAAAESGTLGATLRGRALLGRRLLFLDDSRGTLHGRRLLFSGRGLGTARRPLGSHLWPAGWRRGRQRASATQEDCQPCAGSGDGREETNDDSDRQAGAPLNLRRRRYRRRLARGSLELQVPAPLPPGLPPPRSPVAWVSPATAVSRSESESALASAWPSDLV